MYRIIMLSHRYLGIGVGIVMAMWCLSGFVMMYMPFPAVNQATLLSGLQPINTERCCNTEKLSQLGLVDVNRFVIEMIGDQLAIRFNASNRQNPIVNLNTGDVIKKFDTQAAQAIANRYSPHTKQPAQHALIETDQWTVTRFFAVDRPLHKFTYSDAAATQVYVSSQRGKVVQITTEHQRFWNWFGAIPHWLYPTVLRQHDGLWAQTVIALSILGIFLTLFGIYLGWVRFKKLPSGRRSPYRGVGLWHHYVGLVFGVLILTWVTSGLLSMNPWQLFDFSGGEQERKRLTGIPLSVNDVSRFVNALPQLTFDQPIKRIEGYALNSRLYYLVYDEQGNRTRFSGTTHAIAPVTVNEWQQLSDLAIGNTGAIGNAGVNDASIADAALINEEDNYYYGHHQPRRLPVFRIIKADPQKTHLYLDGTSGELVGYFDQQRRWYRWLFSGLHQLDLTNTLRSRPLWDIVMWLLLAGVTLGTLTGCYLGCKRLLR